MESLDKVYRSPPPRSSHRTAIQRVAFLFPERHESQHRKGHEQDSRWFAGNARRGRNKTHENAAWQRRTPV